MVKKTIICLIVVLTLGLTGCGVAKQDYDKLNADYQATTTKLAVISAEKETLESKVDNLNKECTDLTASTLDLKKQVEELKNKHPRHFTDRAELLAWRIKAGIIAKMSWTDAVLELQRQGIEAGYIISTDIDGNSDGSLGLSLTVIAGDSFYMIFPDDLTLTYISKLR